MRRYDGSDDGVLMMMRCRRCGMIGPVVLMTDDDAGDSHDKVSSAARDGCVLGQVMMMMVVRWRRRAGVTGATQVRQGVR